MPYSTPKLERSKVISAFLQRFHAERNVAPDLLKVCPIVTLANRGYYRDTMGEPGKNDVGIYDDAAWLIDLRNGSVQAFRWNTDPSRLGFNEAIDKPFGILMPGLWPFFAGLHHNKIPAWRQFDDETAAKRLLGAYFTDQRKDGSFQVWRGDYGKNPEWGYQAINQHPGNPETTSSWACQTSPPEQWAIYQKESYRLTKETRQPLLPYLLTADWLQA